VQDQYRRYTGKDPANLGPAAKGREIALDGNYHSGRCLLAYSNTFDQAIGDRELTTGHIKAAGVNVNTMLGPSSSTEKEGSPQKSMPITEPADRVVSPA